MCNCSCWPWHKSTPPPPASPYSEGKSVIRPLPSPISISTDTSKHGRVLSTMHIKDGKPVVTFHTISDEEAKQMFRPSNTSQVSRDIFSSLQQVRLKSDPVSPPSTKTPSVRFSESVAS